MFRMFNGKNFTKIINKFNLKVSLGIVTFSVKLNVSLDKNEKRLFKWVSLPISWLHSKIIMNEHKNKR